MASLNMEIFGKDGRMFTQEFKMVYKQLSAFKGRPASSSYFDQFVDFLLQI